MQSVHLKRGRVQHARHVHGLCHSVLRHASVALPGRPEPNNVRMQRPVQPRRILLQASDADKVSTSRIDGTHAEPLGLRSTDQPSTSAPAQSSEAKPDRFKTVRAGMALLQHTQQVLIKNIWPIITVHLICDLLVFLLHRSSHRLANEAAVRFLGGPVTSSAIGNLWWLSSDPAIANFATGYQYVTFVFFLLAFPLQVLVKSFAAAATVRVCDKDMGARVQAKWWNPFRGIALSRPVLASLASELRSIWKRVFVVDLIVAAVVAPLQLISLAVVTLPLTLPRILDLQAASAVAVLEGEEGMSAIRRSQSLLKPLRWVLAGPFLGLLLSKRLLDVAKGLLLTAMPPRFYRQLPEVPVGILVGATLLSVVLARLQDVLPYVAYKEALHPGEADAKDAGLIAESESPDVSGNSIKSASPAPASS